MTITRAIRIALLLLVPALIPASAARAASEPASASPRDHHSIDGDRLGGSTADSSILVAQAQGEQPRELQPRYQPVEPQPKGYNNEYVFALTRGVADSTLHPAAKVPFFFFTIPLDIVALPITTLAGFF